LAAQLGVSGGTVRVAYQRLIDEQFAIGFGAAGARVAERTSPSSTPDWLPVHETITGPVKNERSVL
jgi:GntR family transcriptional regulator / MocR family aminotransferase